MVTQTLSRSGVMYSPMKAARQENSMRWNFTGVAHEVGRVQICRIHGLVASIASIKGRRGSAVAATQCSHPVPIA